MRMAARRTHSDAMQARSGAIQARSGPMQAKIGPAMEALAMDGPTPEIKKFKNFFENL